MLYLGGNYCPLLILERALDTTYLIANLQKDKYLILKTSRIYEKTPSNKSWKSRPSETKKVIVSEKDYLRFLNQKIKDKKASIRSSKTDAGFYPTLFTSLSADGKTKVIDSFFIVSKENLRKTASSKELEVLQDIKSFDMVYGILCLYDSQDRSIAYNLDFSQVVRD